MLQRGAERLAGSSRLPTSLRAVLGYYADTGVFDYRSLQLQRRVDDATETMIDDAFGAVEDAVASEFGYDAVSFDYDTKLVLPAELTLGYLYRRLDEDDHDRAEAVTRLVIEALVDGDMRDAINDDEYEDFEVDVDADVERVAELAQTTLQSRVEHAFEAYPDAVREAYDWAVDISERHQDEDDQFRRLLAAAQDDRGERGDGGADALDSGGADGTDSGAGDSDALDPETARERIREEYKFAAFADSPAMFSPEELDLPYLKTQYDRVGVIYDGMVEMYREAGLPIEDAFKKSIVLAIIGAQVWLDDVDDYRADAREGQLTPVTAEYLLSESDGAAADAVVGISERYLDLAGEHARTVDSTLTGIAAEYIYRSGEPEVLPGR